MLPKEFKTNCIKFYLKNDGKQGFEESRTSCCSPNPQSLILFLTGFFLKQVQNVIKFSCSNEHRSQVNTSATLF